MIFTFHPAKQRPRTAAALAFGLGILLQALWQWLDPVSALTIWCALLFTLRDFFAPSSYELNSQGLVVDGLLKVKKVYPWKRFRSYLKDRNGLFLSPYRKKKASEGYRGVFVALNPEQRDAFEQYCQDLGLEKRQK